MTTTHTPGDEPVKSATLAAIEQIKHNQRARDCAAELYEALVRLIDSHDAPKSDVLPLDVQEAEWDIARAIIAEIDA